MLRLACCIQLSVNQFLFRQQLLLHVSLHNLFIFYLFIVNQFSFKQRMLLLGIALLIFLFIVNQLSFKQNKAMIIVIFAKHCIKCNFCC